MSRFYPAYDGGDLHPEAEAILTLIAAGDFPPLHAMSPADARMAFLVREWLGTAREEVAVTRTTAGEVPVRIYTPRGESGPLPVLVFLHGGGFVLGNLDEFEPFCTFLSADARCIVVSVNYRLAPESPFPAALDDAWSATQWVASQAPSFGGDPARLAVAGDSAGANLAAVVAVMARDQGSPRIVHQTLICPCVDLSPASEETHSYRHFGQGLWLSAEGMAWYRRLYLGDIRLADDPRVSPLLAPDLSGLPSALIVLAEFDILLDQGRSFARRLRAAGVAVEQRLYPGMLHDFVTLPGLFPSAWKAIDEITRTLREAYSPS